MFTLIKIHLKVKTGQKIFFSYSISIGVHLVNNSLIDRLSFDRGTLIFDIVYESKWETIFTCQISTLLRNVIEKDIVVNGNVISDWKEKRDQFNIKST